MRDVRRGRSVGRIREWSDAGRRHRLRRRHDDLSRRSLRDSGSRSERAKRERHDDEASEDRFHQCDALPPALGLGPGVPFTATTLPSLSASGRVVTTFVPGCTFGLMTCASVSVCTPTRTGTACGLVAVDDVDDLAAFGLRHGAARHYDGIAGLLFGQRRADEHAAPQDVARIEHLQAREIRERSRGRHGVDGLNASVEFDGCRGTTCGT